MDKNKIQKISFSAPINITAAAPENDGTKKPATFSIRAYNGDKINVCNYCYAPVVFDLSGLIVSNQQIPILDSHETDNDKVLGQTSSITIANGGIDETGTLYSHIDDQAAMIVAKAAAGHKWQASVGVKPLSIEEVAAGVTVNVNGKNITGPVDIIRTGVLVETSIVVIGADSTSTVQISAKLAKTPPKTTVILI